MIAVSGQDFVVSWWGGEKEIERGWQDLWRWKGGKVKWWKGALKQALQGYILCHPGQAPLDPGSSPGGGKVRLPQRPEVSPKQATQGMFGVQTGFETGISMKPILPVWTPNYQPAWSSRALPSYKLPPDDWALGLHARTWTFSKRTSCN